MMKQKKTSRWHTIITPSRALVFLLQLRLEAHKVPMAVGVEPDGDDGEGVDEPLAVAPVVGDLNLDLILCPDGLPDLLHGGCVDGGSGPGALRASGPGGLEKAAVSTNYLFSLVTCNL